MAGHELTIEQSEMADLQPRHQPCQCYLRSIGHPAKHRFPEEGPAELHAIKPTDELTVVPAFDRMGMPHRVEAKRCALDHGVDPRLFPVRAGQQHLMKGLVASDRETPRFQPLRE